MLIETALEKLLHQVPPEIMDSLTEEERVEVWQAANPISWRRHPINIRLTVPGFKTRYFLTVVGGPERRSWERIRRERHLHPLRTLGNILFMLGIGASVYLAVIFGFLAFAKLLEF
jgi:hypothetical protein